MTARVESRYIAPKAALCELMSALGPDLACLSYKVTNYYLDTEGGRFSGVSMGSPRLRVRLYESAPYVFGQLERKRQVTPSETEKECWPAREAWPLVLRAMPWLQGIALDEPSGSHALAVLQPEPSAARLDLADMRYVGALSYRRVSCAGGGLRVTADWDFEPGIVSSDLLIVETKSAADNQRLLSLEALGLQPLGASKFSLLQRSAA